MSVATVPRRLTRLTPGDGAAAAATVVFLVLALLLRHISGPREPENQEPTRELEPPTHHHE